MSIEQVKENYKERMERREREKQEEIHAAIEFFNQLMTGYSFTGSWRNLHFEEGGKTRLASVAGWLMGMRQFGNVEQAGLLAHDLHQKLLYLNEYGGTVDLTPENAQDDRKLEFPKFKVVIHDDGTFNGFSIAWYRLMPFEDVKRHAQNLLGEEDNRNRDGFEWTSWDRVLTDTRKHFRIFEPLRESRYYWPDWDKERSCGTEMVSAEYKFSHVGGLLYHGVGKGNNFAMVLGECKGWSIHT